MRDLSAPLRVTWSLPVDSREAERYWRLLIEARVLFVEIEVTARTLPVLLDLIPLGLTGSGAKVSLLASGGTAMQSSRLLPSDEAERMGMMLLPPYPDRAEVAELERSFHTVEWCLWSTRDGLGEFATALSRARECAGHAVAILNPGQPCAALNDADRKEAARVWSDLGEGVASLRVHDLFLDEALGRDPFSHYAGCQAASGLAHLTANGELLACRTLPEMIGDLRRETLLQAWSGAKRLAWSSALQVAPAECAGCGVASVCRGGCPGFRAPRGRDASCNRHSGRRNSERNGDGLPG